MAEEGGYCIPAFNVYNTETIMGVVAAAEEAKAPVIIQVYPRLIYQLDKRNAAVYNFHAAYWVCAMSLWGCAHTPNTY